MPASSAMRLPQKTDLKPGAEVLTYGGETGRWNPDLGGRHRQHERRAAADVTLFPVEREFLEAAHELRLLRRQEARIDAAPAGFTERRPYSIFGQRFMITVTPFASALAAARSLRYRKVDHVDRLGTSASASHSPAARITNR